MKIIYILSICLLIFFILSCKMSVQKITYKHPIKCRQIEFEIMDIYESNIDDDTALSEIVFYRNNEKVELEFNVLLEYFENMTKEEVDYLHNSIDMMP